MTENASDAVFHVFRSNGYSDLATIHTEEDLDEVLIDGFYTWIGLKRYDHSHWYWTTGPHGWESNQFDNWARGEPDSHDDCAMIFSKNRK